MPRKYVKKVEGRPYLNYSDAYLQKVLDLVRSKELSIREAMKQYGIHRNIIAKKLKQLPSTSVNATNEPVGSPAVPSVGSSSTLVDHSRKPGGQTALSVAEEEVICSHLIALASFGFPVTRRELRFLVQSYLVRNNRRIPYFRDNLPGRDWTNSFLRRHREKLISVKMSQSVAGLNRDTINLFLDNLTQELAGDLHHSGVPAFTCDLCSKGFYMKNKLKQHIQLHSSRLSTRVNRQNKLKKINCGVPSGSKKQCMNGDESVLVKLEVVSDEDSSCDKSSFGCGFESFIEIDEKPLIEHKAHDMECSGVILTAIKQEVIHEELEDGNMNEHVSYDKVRADEDDCALDIKKEEPPKLVTLTEARSSLHVLRSYALRIGKISNEFLSALVTIENALDNASLEQE